MKQIIIPEAALEQHIAVLAKTGKGKTYAAKGAIVEPLLDIGRTVGVVDPTGVWWGLRSDSKGTGPGFKVLVLGGDHGDLPLPALGGAAVARLLAEQRVSLIADTSQLTVGERTRWTIDFANTLYRANRQPLYLILDEAHMFAPQGKVPDIDTGKMLHAVNTLASGGRARGIRLTMITQRPAKLHKDTLTCADTLIALGMLAPHDRQAVKAWIDGAGDAVKGREVLDSIAGLPRGEGWVWYPEGAHLVRSKFPRIRTFDSSATPQHGEELAQPKRSAEIDLTEIRAALADAVKQAEENDPKLLRGEIARLKALVGSQPPAVSKEERAAEYARGRVDGFEAGRLRGRDEVLDRAARAYEPLKTATEALAAVNEAMSSLGVLPRTEKASVAMKPLPVLPPKPRDENAKSGDGSLPKAERLILTALAQYPDGRTKVQVAVLAGYAVNGGGFKNALGALRSAGRVDGSPEHLSITEAGRMALGSFEPLPHGSALLEHWYSQLGKAERKTLEALVEVYPRTLSKAQLAARAGYDEGGGGFKNALGRLRTLELIKGRAEIKASEDLFDG